METLIKTSNGVNTIDFYRELIFMKIDRGSDAIATTMSSDKKIYGKVVSVWGSGFKLRDESGHDIDVLFDDVIDLQ